MTRINPRLADHSDLTEPYFPNIYHLQIGVNLIQELLLFRRKIAFRLLLEGGEQIDENF